MKVTRTITIKLTDTQSITVTSDGKGSGAVSSEGIKTEGDADSVEELVANAAVDGMEALILAAACAGIDISSPAFRTAVVSANDAITNNI